MSDTPTVTEAATTTASDAVAAVRAELAAEEAALGDLAEVMTVCSLSLGRMLMQCKASIEETLRYYEPTLRPLYEVSHAAGERRQLLQMRVTWVERALAHHKALSGGDDGDDGNGNGGGGNVSLRMLAEAMLQDAQRALQHSYDALESCPVQALRTLGDYAYPPDAAMATLQLVLRLRGESDCSWSAAQVLVSPTYLCNFFVAHSKRLLQQHDLLPRPLLCALEAFFAHPSHTVAELYKCSEPIGCLGEWLHAVRQYYRVKLVTAPLLLATPLACTAATAATSAAVVACDGGDGVDDAERATEQHARALLHELMYSTTAELVAASAMTESDTATTMAASSAKNDDAHKKKRSNTSTNTSMDNSASNGHGDGGGGEEQAEAEERALLSHYKTLKERLQRHSAPQASLQAELAQLRERISELDAGVGRAEAAVQDARHRMETSIHDLIMKYDTNMLLTQDELESCTDAFVQRITHASGGATAVDVLAAAKATVNAHE